MIYNDTINGQIKLCNFFAIYIVILVFAFLIITGYTVHLFIVIRIKKY